MYINGISSGTARVNPLTYTTRREEKYNEMDIKQRQLRHFSETCHYFNLHRDTRIVRPNIRHHHHRMKVNVTRVL